jgi:hypothetical protein
MMPGPVPLPRFWSDDLGWSLLTSLPGATLARHWGPPAAGPGPSANGSHDRLRQDLLTWARHDEQVRHWIVHAWREAHPEATTATDHVLNERLTANGIRVLEGFPAGEVLLALLTDEYDDGPKLARTFVNGISSEGQRRTLLADLKRLLGETGTAEGRQIRVIILGGHPQDAKKLDRQLFGNSPFQVRWETFERKQTGGGVRKAVVSVLRHADAAVIVTGMASHALMQFAKDAAKRCGLQWTCIDKATNVQLKAALCELFPDCLPPWD